MDLSFCSSPSNLDEVVTRNAPANNTIQKSREGYIGFLSIIDVASRHLWTHPVSSKDPPIKFLDKFLKKNGIKTTDPNKAIKITTSENGYLAKSRAFKNVVHQHNMTVEPISEDEIKQLLPEEVEAFIMTDGGGEFDTDKFRKTAESHGYDVTTTAADASHQNGIIERPHQTLKERIRCMLYVS